MNVLVKHLRFSLYNASNWCERYQFEFISHHLPPNCVLLLLTHCVIFVIVSSFEKLNVRVHQYPNTEQTPIL